MHSLAEEDRQGRGAHESAGGGCGVAIGGQGGKIFIGCYFVGWQISITV
jgi:hypothetical protein